MSRNRDEFFIGWEPTPARGPVRFVRNATLTIAGAAVVLAGLFGAWQSTIGDARAVWTPREFRGVVIAEPVPMLMTEMIDDVTGSPLYFIANQHGVGPDLGRRFHLREVKLQASLMSRARGLAMLEVVPDSVRVVGSDDRAEPLGPSRSLGTRTLRGEIVDAKCYMGAMNPGERKPHRACAILCIDGGLPAVFVVRGPGGTSNSLVLLDENGRAVSKEILEYVALPMEITGEVRQIGHMQVIEAPISSYRMMEE